MMSLSLKISDATFTKFVSKLTPYIDLAKAFYLFGGSEALSLRNFANSALPATVIGTPTYDTNCINCTSLSNGIGSGVINNSPFTHIGVFSGSSLGYMGNWGADAANLVTRQGANLALAIDANLRVDAPLVFDSSFRFMAASHDGVTAKIFHRTSSAMIVGSTLYGASSTVPTQFRVGASTYYDTTVFKAAAAMTFQQALTEGQIAEIYVYLKMLLSTRGVTVL